MFLENFPQGYKPRDIQKKVIEEIESKIKSGYKNILVCAPTGIGKSHIALTVAKSLKSSFILTGQKILQDQYTHDFSWIYPMKGKSNFPCLALYNPRKTSYEKAIRNENLLCSKGTCSWKPKGSSIREYCEFKPNREQFEIKFKGTEKEIIHAPKGMCYYYNQKFQALLATHSIFNYASFFQTKKYNSGIEDLLEKNCLIADESHEIEHEIIGFIGFDIRKSHLDDVGWTFTPYDLEDIDSVKKLVEDLGEVYVIRIRELEDYQNTDPNLSKFRRRLEKLDRLLQELIDDSKNMVVQPDYADTSNTTLVSIKPLNISKYIHEFFNYKHQIFLSATIDKTMFCKNMGFNEEECAFIEVEKSPFPLKNRTVNFLNIKNLNMSTSQEDWNHIYQEIDKIMKIHPNDKGLILTSSILQCKKIIDNVSTKSKKRLMPVYSDFAKQRDEILEAHDKTSEPSILLSPSLWVGVDLIDELSRFQIIVKTPYLPLYDKRTKTKMENNRVWYMYETLVRLLQGFGRSIRHEKDFAVTYVLDGAAERLIKNMEKYVPKAYYDVLGWDNTSKN